MTIGEAVDLILIHVDGGHLTQDSNVLRADIRAYLPAAINYFTVAEMRMRRAEARGDSFIPSNWSDGSFFGIYTLTPVNSEYGWYVDLPGHIVSLFNARGLESVYPIKAPLMPFIRMSNPSELAGAEQIMGPNVFYYPETAGEVTRLRLLNFSGSACDVIVRAMLDISALSDDSPLPVPAGVDMAVVDKCVQHFAAQRMSPADIALDGNDLNQNHPNNQNP